VEKPGGIDGTDGEHGEAAPDLGEEVRERSEGKLRERKSKT
jgi:hypothetical protein